MTGDLSLTRRATGRRLSAALGIGCLTLAGYTAYAEAVPALGINDGAWMLLWSSVAVLGVAPVVWRWPRQRSLAVVAVAAFVGCWAPIVISALRHQMPIMARLKGSWVLAGGGIVGVAAPLAFVCLWLAIHEHRERRGTDDVS